jgi:two-component system response regulator YesN
MYSLLIVDDEPIIANSLYEVFRNLDAFELDVCRVYSGKAALEWLDKNKVDIVLTDIHMPGIDGIQLLEHIRLSWPGCRVILLTGYNEFDYVYKAIQHKGVSYLLKTEDYDKIIKTVEDAIADIKKSLIMEDIINKANKQIAITSALLQKEYFSDILKGTIEFEDVNHEQFKQLGIPLNPGMPVLIMVGRLDSAPGRLTYSERTKRICAFKLIAEQYLSQLTSNICISDEYSNLIWFLQPKEHENGSFTNQQMEKSKVFVKGMIEVIQASCNESLEMSVSFAISSASVEWNGIVKSYDFLKQLLDYRIGSGTGMLLIDKKLYSDGFQREDINKVQLLQIGLKKLGTLNTFLERGQKTEFFRLFDELTFLLNDVISIHYNPALEMYYSISLMFLSYINRWDLTERIAFNIGLSRLTYLDQHSSWKDSTNYLKEIAEIIFNIQNNEQEKRTFEAIAHIQKYIDEHIHMDISLVKLADLVYFNPSYLSRLFKQIKGENLSEYILSKKVEKAKQLLEDPEIKIYEVAEAVGYNASQNFSRLFKKITGITPQEYRDFYLSSKIMS